MGLLTSASAAAILASILAQFVVLLRRSPALSLLFFIFREKTCARWPCCEKKLSDGRCDSHK
jgi:hypothetical protein